MCTNIFVAVLFVVALHILVLPMDDLLKVLSHLTCLVQLGQDKWNVVTAQ